MHIRLNNLFIYLFILFTFSCKFFDQNKVAEPVKLITDDEAKSIVIESILSDDFDRQYYILDSPNFDERVRAISWGKIILVRRITNEVLKKIKPREGYYYLLTGILPDGQILGTEVIDAQTREMLCGQRFMRKGSDTLRIASETECIEYAKQYLHGDLKCEAVYYFDGTRETYYEDLTWRYLVQPVSSDAVSRGFTGTDYVLIDPYVQNFKTDNTLKSTNGFLSRVGYNHRAFRFDLTRGNGDKKMVPID